MRTFILLVAFVSLFVALVSSDPSGDRVTSMPGFNMTIPFKHYSGYLSANGQKRLHYWFVESQSNPSSDPVLLWLNGGPGCSSLDGMLEEHGPFHLSPDGSKGYINEWAWNRFSNVIYLEAPAGVGFSYSPDVNDYATNDIQVAQDNLAALKDFFSKFPEFAGNDFYVTGESYGGVYVPSLAAAIVASNSAGGNGNRINLKGIMVGNGLSDYRLNDNSVVFFAYSHGLIGSDLWNTLTSACCQPGQDPSKYTCNFHDPEESSCITAVSEAMVTVYNSGLNFYSLYLNCTNTPALNQRLAFDMNNVFRNIQGGFPIKAFYSEQAKTKLFKEGGFVGEEVPCINSYAPERWLNSPAVRAALHIPSNVQRWSICSGDVGSQYSRNFTNMADTYQTLLKAGLRAVVYNGDTDMACNVLGDEAFVTGLKRPITNKYRPWHDDGQVAGFVVDYDQISFVTVKGSGHMVPQWRPAQAFAMARTWIRGGKLD